MVQSCHPWRPPGAMPSSWNLVETVLSVPVTATGLHRRQRLSLASCRAGVLSGRAVSWRGGGGDLDHDAGSVAAAETVPGPRPVLTDAEFPGPLSPPRRQRAESAEKSVSNSTPSISCLCVTQDRHAFLPWLMWNYQKQDYPARELVIVDGSVDPFRPPAPDVRVVTCGPRATVAEKRNIAVDAARGAIVTWFDDDDWQHPRKLSQLVAALGDAHVAAGSRQGWFIDLRGSRGRVFRATRGVLFNSMAVRRNALHDLRFDELRQRAADTPWLAALRRKYGEPQVVEEVLTCWLCHESNLSNPSSRHVFDESLEDVARSVGVPAGSGAPTQLRLLRQRLARGTAKNHHRQRLRGLSPAHNF
jgi:hypothetical protein